MRMKTIRAIHAAAARILRVLGVRLPVAAAYGLRTR